MTETALTPPDNGTREDLIAFYRSLLATPRTIPQSAQYRRRGREGLTLLGAAPVATPLERRRLFLVSLHFRAKRPKGRLRRL